MKGLPPRSALENGPGRALLALGALLAVFWPSVAPVIGDVTLMTAAAFGARRRHP